MMSYSNQASDQDNIPVHGGLSLGELRALGMTREGVIDFSVNINPLGPPPGVREALKNLDLSVYPDPENLELREALSHITGAPLEQIVIGNGSTELIHLLTQIYLREGNTAFILAPTFSEYEVAAKMAGADIYLLRADEREGFIWNMTMACKEIQQREPKLVFLCNPNNPTGVYLQRGEVEELVAAIGNGLLVLDEAYIAFVQKAWDACELLNRENIVILHSLTKEYALAGLRLGYALCPQEVATALFARQPTWSVNTSAQVAGLVALSEGPYLERSKNCVEAGKNYLFRELEALGYRVLPSAANFLLVKVGNATHLRRQLLSKGICVRDCSSFGLPEYIRVGVRTMLECKRLITVLRKVMLEQV